MPYDLECVSSIRTASWLRQSNSVSRRRPRCWRGFSTPILSVSMIPGNLWSVARNALCLSLNSWLQEHSKRQHKLSIPIIVHSIKFLKLIFMLFFIVNLVSDWHNSLYEMSPADSSSVLKVLNYIVIIDR